MSAREEEPGVYDVNLVARIVQDEGESHPEFVNRTYRMFVEMQDAIGKHDAEILDDYGVEWVALVEERKPTFAMEETVSEAVEDVARTPEDVADEFLDPPGTVVLSDEDAADAAWIRKELESRRSATVASVNPVRIEASHAAYGVMIDAVKEWLDDAKTEVAEDPGDGEAADKLHALEQARDALHEASDATEECDGCGLEFGPYDGHYHKHCG